MELSAAPIPGIPAPYGRACSNCARAKAKCVAGNGLGTKCERCLRLNKDCQTTQTVRKRKTVNKPPATKVERLEERLDGLFKLLQSSNSSISIADGNASASNAPSTIQPSPSSLQSHVVSPENCEDFESHEIQRQNSNRPTVDGLCLDSPTVAPDAAYSNSGTRSTIYYCPESMLISSSEPSSEDAEECLKNFRPHMATFFPFIIVPESTTAQDLRRDRPFLWLCIMSVSSKSTIQQKALGREIKITMGREILVEGKNNIDLLLGMLVFVAWGHYHIKDKNIMIQTTQLIIALVGNLRLNKPLLREPALTLLNLDARGCPQKHSSPSTRTTEERRAILGCYTLSSVFSSYFQRLDALRWTPYMDECIAVLAEKEEYSTDILLVYLAKLQLIFEKAGRGQWYEEQNDAIDSTRAPPIFYLKALQAQLQDFKAYIPPKIQRNDVLLLHLYSTEFRVHEIALSKASAIVNSPGFQRLDSLYSCLHAVKSWFDLFLKLPLASYVGFSAPIFIQLAQCIMGLFRLLTLDDPDWDQGLVRDTADLSLILNRIIEKHNQVKVFMDLDHGSSEDKDIFSGTARTLSSIQTWWDAKIGAEVNDRMDLDGTLGELNMDFLDDVWLRDIFSQGEGQFDLDM